MSVHILICRRVSDFFSHNIYFHACYQLVWIISSIWFFWFWFLYFPLNSFLLVGRDWRIHWLYLCWEVPPTSVLVMTVNDIRWWRSNPRALRNLEHPFNASTISSTLIGVVVPVRVPSTGQIDLLLKMHDICHCLPPDRTWHKVNDPKVDYGGDLGRGMWGTSRGSSPAGLYWSSALLVLCGPDEPRWSWTQIWVQACMSAYSLNWTARSSAIKVGKKVSMLQFAHPKVAQPKLVAFRPQVCHGGLTVRHKCQTADYPF